MKITRYETNYDKKIYFKECILKDKKLSQFKEREIINIYPNVEYQTFLGFGGAITESAGYCFKKLYYEKQSKVIEEYFSYDGLNYSLVRLPIGSCDFGLDTYSYSYKHDLSDFSITRDRQYIIPLLKRAFESNPNLTIFASPWSPPKFMKSTRWLNLGGKLRNKYKQTWADYLAKYILAYKQEGFDIKYITVQNEPNAVQLWESCLYNPEQESDFAINYLEPTLRNNNLNTKILIWDHNKERLFNRASAEFSVEGSEKIEGIAYHYYSGDHFENLKLVREKFPNKILIHTEGCTGYSNFRPEDEIQNGEIYAHDILGDLNSGSNGYIDWNIILDHQGGPNHKKNYCNSPMMLNTNESDYIKNLTYSYIGHFSKFIHPNAKRLGISKYTDKIEVTSFKNIDDSIVIVILNKNDFELNYNICINDRFIKDNIDCHSIYTYKIKM